MEDVPGPHPPEIDALINQLIPLSPYPEPTVTLPAILGSWRSLYARYGSGTSQGRSERDRSNLSLQSFNAVPPIAIDVTEGLQEIGKDPPAYNNIIFFRTVETGCAGYIIVHGTWSPEPDNPKRLKVVFYSAELKPLPGGSEAGFRDGISFTSDAALKRDFKPAKLWSDVVYLDEDSRVNFGGMGGVYVLTRRPGPAITLAEPD